MYFNSMIPWRVSAFFTDLSCRKYNRQVEKDRQEREEYEERKRALEEDDLDEYERMRLEGYVLEYEGKMKRREAAHKEMWDRIERNREYRRKVVYGTDEEAEEYYAKYPDEYCEEPLTKSDS